MAAIGPAGPMPPVTLASLMWDWGSAYAIGYGGDQWLAGRRDGGGVLAADALAGLEAAIEADHRHRPVPRQYGPPDTSTGLEEDEAPGDDESFLLAALQAAFPAWVISYDPAPGRGSGGPGKRSASPVPCFRVPRWYWSNAATASTLTRRSHDLSTRPRGQLVPALEPDWPPGRSVANCAGAGRPGSLDPSGTGRTRFRPGSRRRSAPAMACPSDVPLTGSNPAIASAAGSVHA